MVRAALTFRVSPSLPAALEPLAELAGNLAAWKRRVAAAWPHVTVNEVTADVGDARKGETRQVAAVQLGDLDSGDVVVEALHGSVRADGVIESPRRFALEPDGEPAAGRQRATDTVICDVAGECGVAVRARPHHPDLTDDLELGLAAWARPDDV